MLREGSFLLDSIGNFRNVQETVFSWGARLVVDFATAGRRSTVVNWILPKEIESPDRSAIDGFFAIANAQEQPTFIRR